MNIARPLDFTFKRHLQNVYYASDVVDRQDILPLLSKFEHLDTLMSNVTPLLFAIDYTRSQYLIMTNTCKIITGHSPQEFLEAGIPFLIEVYQKDDFKVYNEDVFTANMNFLKSQPQADHHKFVFSYNFRVKDKRGNYIPVMQRGSYITSKETGLPLYSLGIVMDIRLFKKDHVIYHSIERMEESGNMFDKQIVEENYFYPYGEDKLLSRHETHILECMAEGWSSKQIASKFNITENTVSNHRKNILKKTNTKNVAELIAFACRNGLI